MTNMNTLCAIAFLSALLFVFASPPPAQALGDCLFYTGCERKICELEREIESALEHGNTKKADKLKEELAAFRTHCPDGDDTAVSGHELHSLQANIQEYAEELAHVKREFGEKAEAAALRSSRSKALDELDEELNDAVDDVAEAGGDLKEDVADFLDEMDDLGAVPTGAAAQAETLIREIKAAGDDLATLEHAIKSDLSDALSRIGADDRRTDFDGDLEDLADELGKQRETLRQADAAARELLDRAS